MDLKIYVIRKILASRGTLPPRQRLDRDMDIYARLQVLLGAMGKTDGQATNFIKDYLNATVQKQILKNMSKTKEFKETAAKNPLYFSDGDTQFYSKIRKTLIRLISSAGFGDLDADDVLMLLMSGQGISGGVRQMGFVSAGRTHSRGIKGGTTTLRSVGNSIIGYANNMIRTEISTRKHQRGVADPFHLQPGMDDGPNTSIQHEISNFQGLELRDKFEFLVDLTLSDTVLGNKITKEIQEIIKRLPKRQSEIGQAWFDRLLEKSSSKGSFNPRGLGVALAKLFGIKPNTISGHLKRITTAIGNELPKNKRLMVELDEAIAREELGYGLKRANKTKTSAQRIVLRYLKYHQIS